MDGLLGSNYPKMRSIPLGSELSDADLEKRQSEALQSLMDVGRGVSYAPFDFLGAPVDVTNALLSPITTRLGIYSDTPFMGSDYLIDAYSSIFPSSARTGSTGETVGRVLGGFLSGKSAIKVADEINSAMKARQLRQDQQKHISNGDQQKAKEVGDMANILETDAAPLTGILQRIEANGQKPQFEVRDDGTYLTIRPSTASDDGEALVKTVRAKNNGSKGEVVEGSKLTKAEIDYIVNDPNLNSALITANRISMETNGVPYDLDVLSADKVGRKSSLAKQAAIGRAFMLAADGSPEYKATVFSAYSDKYPELMEVIGAKGYDDLLEKSYRQLAAETKLQFRNMPIQTTYHGGDLEYATSTGGTNSIAMMQDVLQNQNLNVFRGGDPHDFLHQIDPETGLNMNEMFRAVHDYFGHGVKGNKFDALGEELAYGSHSQMFSPLARFAMAAETRGQNSVVNYSPLNLGIEKRLDDLRSELPKAKGAEQENILQEMSLLNEQRKYAPQKSLLLPPEMVDLSYQGGMPDYMMPLNKPEVGTAMDDLNVLHYSPQKGLLEVDPSYTGQRMGGVGGYGRQEASDIKYYERPDRSYFFRDTPPDQIVDPAMRDSLLYEGQVSGVYDAMADPLGLLGVARLQNKGNTINRQPFYKDFEQSIKDYGYTGYSAPLLGQSAVQMFYPTRVRGVLND